MLHVAFEVTGLAADVELAAGLGAELDEYQTQRDVRVRLDPAGHPFSST